VVKTLDTIKMMGFTEIEGGGNGMSPVDFRKLCDDRGIGIPYTGTGYDELIKYPDSIIYRAKILGAKYIMCAWIPHGNGVLTFDVPLGTGEIDIPGILKEAKKIGIKHYFIENESKLVNEQVPQNIIYLKSLNE
jgi:sugar phosphate isomerase/epimerase